MLHLPWIESTLTVLDFEGNTTSGILEYGLVSLHKGKVQRTQTRLCRPTGAIRPEDTAVHGLDVGMTARAEPFAADWEIFCQAREAGPLAAHFASTENALLKQTWPYPRHAPDFFGLGQMVSEWGPWVDTGKMIPALFTNITSAKLDTLLAAFQLQEQLDSLAGDHCPPDRRHYHCALYDALASAVLLINLESYPEFRGRSLPWLLEFSAPERLRKKGFLRQRTLF